jgi:hypothetical protein
MFVGLCIHETLVVKIAGFNPPRDEIAPSIILVYCDAMGEIFEGFEQ